MKTCPACGYCESCGRSGHQVQIVTQPYWAAPGVTYTGGQPATQGHVTVGSGWFSDAIDAELEADNG